MGDNQGGGEKKSTLRCIMDNLGTCVGRGARGVRREVKQEKDESRGKVWLSGAAGRRGKGRSSYFSLTTLSPFFCKRGGGGPPPSGKIGVSEAGQRESKGSFCHFCGAALTLLQRALSTPVTTRETESRPRGLKREVRSLAEAAKATHGSQAGNSHESRHRQSDPNKGTTQHLTH